MTSNPDLSDVLILWDIDGTLIEHAPGKRDRHAHAVEQILKLPMKPIPPGLGKTDRQIVLELFAQHTDPTADQLHQAFEILDAVTQTDLTTTPALAVHGIVQALRHTSDVGATHTVLTGNTPGRARIKVTSADLQTSINLGIGYFGHEHDDRFGLVAAAATRLSANGQRAVIVGDTPLDVQAARAAGLPVIGVATGIVAADQLAEHDPDALFEVLDGHHEAFAHAITALVT